jgi:hypothetical protein
MLTIDLHNGLKVCGSLLQTSRFNNTDGLGTIRVNAFLDGLMALGAMVSLESMRNIEDDARIEITWKTVAPH